MGTDRPATIYRKDLPERIYEELMGKRPTLDEIWENCNEQYYHPEIAKFSIKEFPKWDGYNEAKTMRQWLRDCKRWRKSTSVGLKHHGRALQQSFARGSWMSAIADQLEEDQLERSDSYEFIMREIIYSKKWIFEHEAEVAIEEFIFILWRHNNEQFQSFFTRFDNAKVKLKLQLGYRNHKCEFCKNTLKIANEVPDVITHYLLKKKASLTRDQIEKIQDWFGENYSLEDFVRACNKFDSKTTERRDITKLCKQQPALNAGVYMTSEDSGSSNAPKEAPREVGRLFTPGKPSDGEDQDLCIIDENVPMKEKSDETENTNYLVGEQNPDDGNMVEIDDSSSSDSSYCLLYTSDAADE